MKLTKQSAICLVSGSIGGLVIGFVAGALADGYFESVAKWTDSILNKIDAHKQYDTDDSDDRAEMEAGTHAPLDNDYLKVNNDILKYKHLTQDYKDYNPDKGPDKPAVVHETETDTDEAPQVETNEHGELSDMIVTDAEDAHSTPEASVYSIESSESKIDTGTHLISYEEYNHETEYRKQYLYYFPNEDVLVATESDPPLNPNSFIGEEAYDILVNDDLESDDERVYVRNDKSQVCYAIVYKTDVDWYEWSGRESIDGEGIGLN